MIPYELIGQRHAPRHHRHRQHSSASATRAAAAAAATAEGGGSDGEQPTGAAAAAVASFVPRRRLHLLSWGDPRLLGRLCPSSLLPKPSLF